VGVGSVEVVPSPKSQSQATTSPRLSVASGKNRTSSSWVGRSGSKVKSTLTSWGGVATVSVRLVDACTPSSLVTVRVTV